jgi:hypothetical protein
MKGTPRLPSATRRSILTGVASLGVCGVMSPAHAADTLSNGQFRQEVMTLLEKKRPQWRLRLEPDPTELMIGEKRAYLGNLYKTLDSVTGTARDVRILEFFDATAMLDKDDPAETDFKIAQPRLRARLVHVDYEMQVKGTGLTLLVRPFSKVTRVAYVIDGDKAVQYVMAKHLAAWSTDTNSVHAAGIANLEVLSQDLPINVQSARGGPGRYAMISIADSYAAARLLAPNFMQRLRDALGPTIIVGVPNRDFLIAWTPDYSKRQEFAAQVGKDSKTQAYALTDELFVSSAAGLRVATPQEHADHGRT